MAAPAHRANWYYCAAIGSLGMSLGLDDRPTRLGPGSGLIFEGREEPLRLACFLVIPQRFRQEFLAVTLQHGVHRQAQGVVHVQFFQEQIRLGNGKAAVPRRLICTSGHTSRSRRTRCRRLPITPPPRPPRPPQVLIEAVIVEMTLEEDFELGVNLAHSTTRQNACDRREMMRQRRRPRWSTRLR